MRDLVRGYLDHSLSRRAFFGRMAALGFTASAVMSILEPLDALTMSTEEPVPDAAILQGTGGELVVAQAKAAGVEYLFANPGSQEVGFYDAIADDPQIHFIMGLHEGIVVSMADGYHRVSQARVRECAHRRRDRANGRPTLQRQQRWFGYGGHRWFKRQRSLER